MSSKFHTNRPKVLLLGNGLLQSFGNTVSWNKLLQDMHCNPRIDKDADLSRVSFPLEIVLRTDDHVDTKIKEIKDYFISSPLTPELTQRINKLLNCNFDQILTTNYGYEIEMIAAKRDSYSENFLRKSQRHTDSVLKCESKYLLHTYYSVNDQNIWHIHGDARKYNSIVLGHYYYGKLLSKYEIYLNSQKNRYEYSQKNNKTPEIRSWLDAFILGDVYILGLGMNFSELDLWWLINRKKREKAETGKIHYFEARVGDDFLLKNELLKTYEVQTYDLGISIKDSKSKQGQELFKQFYDKAIDKIVDLNR